MGERLRQGYPNHISISFHDLPHLTSSSSSSSMVPSGSPLPPLGPHAGEPLPYHDTLTGVVLSSSRYNLQNLELALECDSEEAAVAAEMSQHPPRFQSSKRSRAADVHNLSEKRRRSRINEKMKALQNLIPNSNKTDKASMLDEAIEYLKQLQLQVQTLSIRNGLSLHPMCLPGLPGILHPSEFPQVGIDLSHWESLDINVTNSLNMSSTSDPMLNLPKECASSEVASFGLDSCVLPNFGCFELRDKAICREQRVDPDHFIANNTTEMKSPGVKGWLIEQKCGSQETVMENFSVVNQLTTNSRGKYAASPCSQNGKLTIRG